MSTAYAGGKRSSRVKDLVDLVVLAHSQTVDLAELRAAVASKQAISGMDPFDHFDVPAEWRRTYPVTAKGVPSAAAYTAESATALIAAFVDPALTKGSNPGTWEPENLRWSEQHA